MSDLGYELQRSFVGNVIVPGDAIYDHARSGFNGFIDRGPALIAHCADAAERPRAYLRTPLQVRPSRGGACEREHPDGITAADFA